MVNKLILTAQLYLCLGTVKSARTSFLLLDLVFMFMQKSMAACRSQDRDHTVCSYQVISAQSSHLVCFFTNNMDAMLNVAVLLLTLSMRSLLTQLGSCWMKASTISFR